MYAWCSVKYVQLLLKAIAKACDSTVENSRVYIFTTDNKKDLNKLMSSYFAKSSAYNFQVQDLGYT